MWSAVTVLACTLSLLGRSAGALPPIELLDEVPIDVSRNAEAFVRSGEARINLITSAATFRTARQARSHCGDIRSLRKLASVIIHEEWHILHGPDERAAYQAQLTTLIYLGATQSSPEYQSVIKSMNAVLRRRPPAMPPPAPVATEARLRQPPRAQHVNRAWVPWVPLVP